MRREGIWYKSEAEESQEGKEDEDLVVFTDSSYGPGGLDSPGKVVVMHGKGVMWRSGRRSTPASTAESE